MKTAISIPDDLFEDAERLARALNKSRSRLYGDAVREYVARHSADHVTGALDEVLEGVTAERGRLRHRGGGTTLERVCLVISQGEVWWADLVDPASSEPGFRRPVVIVQGDSFNRSRLATVVCVALTSNLRWAEAHRERTAHHKGDRAAQGFCRQRVPDSHPGPGVSGREGRGPTAEGEIDLVLLGVDVVLGR